MAFSDIVMERCAARRPAWGRRLAALTGHTGCVTAAVPPGPLLDGVYQPRNPEQSILYCMVAGNLETFLANHQAEGKPLPHFVERELRAFLTCGILAPGFARLQCESCGKDKLVPYSCKSRAVCSSGSSGRATVPGALARCLTWKNPFRMLTRQHYCDPFETLINTDLNATR